MTATINKVLYRNWRTS